MTKTPPTLPPDVEARFDKEFKDKVFGIIMYPEQLYFNEMKQWIATEIERARAEERERIRKEVENMRKIGDGRTHAKKEAYKRTYDNCPDCGVDITNRHIFALRCYTCSLKRNKKQNQGFGSYNEAIEKVLQLLTPEVS